MAGEWKVEPLERLVDPDRAIAYGIVQPGVPTSDGVPIVRVTDIRDGRIATSDPLRVSREVESAHARTRLRGGELLLTLVGTVGEAAVAPDSLAGWNTARAVAVIPVRQDVGSYWVKLALHSPDVRHIIDSRLNTTVQATLNLRDVAQLPIVVPPEPERRAIAHILGTLDDKIELNRRRSETLEAMARALFRSWFVDFDPVRAKAEGRDPGLPKPVADLFPARLVDSALGEMPEGWEVKAIGDLADVVGGSTPKTERTEYWEGGTYHWVTPKDLSTLSVPVLLETERKITESGLAQISSGLLPVGTVLLSSRAPIGYLAIAEIPVAINQGFIAIKPRDGVSNLFLLRWAKAAHDEIVSHANGSTFLEISKANFRLIRTIAPTSPVMNAFDRLTRPMYRKVMEQERESRTLAALRDTLLPKLITGSIRVRGCKNHTPDELPTLPEEKVR